MVNHFFQPNLIRIIEFYGHRHEIVYINYRYGLAISKSLVQFLRNNTIRITVNGVIFFLELHIALGKRKHGMTAYTFN